MNKNYCLLTLTIFMILVLSSCSENKPDQPDIVNDLFPEAQSELKEVVEQ